MAKAREDLKPLEILVVEDNPGDVYLLTLALQAVRFPLLITVITDGEAAIRHLHPNTAASFPPRPELILLDVNLPKKSGFEVLAALRNDPATSAVSVLMISTSGAATDISRAKKLGANGYIQKGMDLAGLKEVVSKIDAFCLERQRGLSLEVGTLATLGWT